MPLTAHFIGGCAIGDSPETGVIDPYQRVYGHPGLHVADGAADHREPRREPVADDHRPGRAGDGVLAQQGRDRPAPGARRAVRAGRSRSPRAPRSSRTARPARCGCRSSASADRSRRVSAGHVPRRVSLVQTAGTSEICAYLRRNPPPNPSLDRSDPVVMLPPSDRAPSPGAVQQVRGRSGPGHPPSPAGPWCISWAERARGVRQKQRTRARPIAPNPPSIERMASSSSFARADVDPRRSRSRPRGASASSGCRAARPTRTMVAALPVGERSSRPNRPCRVLQCRWVQTTWSDTGERR